MADDPPHPTLLPAFISEWMFSTAMTPPTATGQVRFNNNNQKNVTTIWIDKLTVNGNDATPYLTSLKTGTDVRLTDIADAAKWQSYTLTAVALDKGTYVECPVVWKAGGLTLLATRVVVDLPVVSVYAPVTGFALATSIHPVSVGGQLVTFDFAYPFEGKNYTSPGLTKRQWYATHAMMGFISGATSASNLVGRLAPFAFQVADSMIAFEEKEAAGFRPPPVGTDRSAPAAPPPTTGPQQRSAPKPLPMPRSVWPRKIIS